MSKFAKAIYAFFVAGLGSIVVVLVGDTGLGDVQDGQWAAALLAALVAGGGVYGIKNSTP